jgi:hypothetical protein
VDGDEWRRETSQPVRMKTQRKWATGDEEARGRAMRPHRPICDGGRWSNLADPVMAATSQEVHSRRVARNGPDEGGGGGTADVAV